MVEQLGAALLAFVPLLPAPSPCLPSDRRSSLKETSANLGMPIFQNWIMARTKPGKHQA